MKILAASMALASLSMSGIANAAIMTGSEGTGELYLTVWDQAGKQSYGLDLGVIQKDFMVNPSVNITRDLSLDPNYAGFLNNSGLVYQIVSNDQGFYSSLQSYGLLSTARDGLAATSGIINDPGLIRAMGKVSNWALELNAATGDQTRLSENLSAVTTVGQQGYYDDIRWGISSGTIGWITAQNVGQSVDFIKVGLAPNDPTYLTMVHEQLPNVWKLETNGMLTYAPVSAVPIPAAVWLFGSGLLGLGSIARRRKV